MVFVYIFIASNKFFPQRTHKFVVSYKSSVQPGQKQIFPVNSVEKKREKEK